MKRKLAGGFVCIKNCRAKVPRQSRIRKLAIYALRFTFCLFALSIFSSPGALAQTDSGLIELPKARPEIIRYNRIQYGLYFGGSAWEFLGLGLAVRFGVGALLRRRAERLSRLRRQEGASRNRRVCRIRLRRILRSRFVQAAIVFAGFSALMLLWRIPLQFLSYQVERAYGFATLGPALWLSDRLLGYVFGLVRIPVVWLGFMLFERAPRTWWLILWAFSIPWTLAMTVLNPILFDPAYNRFQTLQNPRLEKHLLELAQKAGIPNATVLVADYSKRTTKVNAYVTGIGPSARMVIWDTTLSAMSEDEIVAIMGHEIGHYKLNHVWWSFVGGVAAAFGILWLLCRLYPWAVRRYGRGIRSPHDLAALPIALFLLTMLLFLQTPLEAAFSRYQERQADRYGLELTRMPEATARAFIAFVDRNYADPDPPRFIVLWFYSHPPLRERVEFALRSKLD